MEATRNNVAVIINTCTPILFFSVIIPPPNLYCPRVLCAEARPVVDSSKKQAPAFLPLVSQHLFQRARAWAVRLLSPYGRLFKFPYERKPTATRSRPGECGDSSLLTRRRAWTE